MGSEDESNEIYVAEYYVYSLAIAGVATIVNYGMFPELMRSFMFAYTNIIGIVWLPLNLLLGDSAIGDALVFTLTILTRAAGTYVVFMICKSRGMKVGFLIEIGIQSLLSFTGVFFYFLSFQ